MRDMYLERGAILIALIDSFISINALIWLFLVAFMLHDVEEIIRIEPWFKKNQKRIYDKVPTSFHKELQTFSSITSSQFAVAVCIEFIIFVPVTFMAAEKDMYMMFLGLNAVLLLHVFMHIGQALMVKMLIPGVVTAVGITLPYTVYLFYRLLNENVVEFGDIVMSLPIGLVLVPIILFGHIAGKKLIPNPTP